MAVVQPVYGPDYGQAILSGLSAYQGVKGMQMNQEKWEYEKKQNEFQEQQQKEKIQKQKELDELSVNSMNDPNAWNTLKVKDPDRALKIQQLNKVDLDRFHKERVETALEIKDLPKEQRLLVLDKRIEMLSKEGRDPSNTIRLRELIAKDDPSAEQILSNVLEQGYQAKILERPPQKKESYKLATEEEKIKAGLDPKKPYQISPQGQITQIGTSGQTFNINTGEPGKIGDVPAGYAVKLDPKTNEFVMYEIKGGPAAKKTAEQKKAENAKNESTAQKVDLVQDDINRLTNLVERQKWYDPVTGISGEWVFSNIPGTARKDAEGLQKTIQANIGFDRLQQMREESPTGGALGQVSDRELDFLKSTMGSIDFNQSDEKILYDLQRMNTVYSGIKKKVMKAVQENPGQFPKAEDWLNNQGLATPASTGRGKETSNQPTPEQLERYR